MTRAGAEVNWLWAAACAGCGQLGDDRLCVRCRAVGVHRLGLDIPGLRGAWVLSHYDSPMGSVLRQAKTRADRDLGWHVATVFARRLEPFVRDAGVSALVPAPSTPRALLTRGFSVAALQARALSDATGIPVVHTLCRRGGERQASLDRLQRQKNLRGRIRCETAPEGRVLLVDDVVTTGATVAACTTELLGAGARQVWLAALCLVGRRQGAAAGRSSLGST